MIHVHRGIQVTDGVPKETDDAIAIEDRFDLLLNDRPVTSMVASRDQLRELGAGYVISEGLVRCVDKVILDDDRILVYSDTGCDLKWKKQETGSSGGQSFFSPSHKVAVASDVRVTPYDVIAITREIETELW